MTTQKLIAEVSSYLDHLKSANAWNEDEAVATVRSILNHHLGMPPAVFTVEGREYTPQSYLRDYLKIDPDDYVDVLSYMQKPFGQQVEYEVPDNWWHSKDYYNVPLDTYMKILKNALRRGYSASLGGDVSEPGRNAEKKVFMIPTFDIPSEYIDDNARQYRFSNGSTTDDHGVHLIGYKETKSRDWFLIKDSGSSAYQLRAEGILFPDGRLREAEDDGFHGPQGRRQRHYRGEMSRGGQRGPLWYDGAREYDDPT